MVQDSCSGCVMRTAPVIFFLFAFWLAPIIFSASAKAQIVICGQNKVRMPSIERHRAWLSRNSRYGDEVATRFYTRAKDFGNDYLNYQVYYFPEHPGGSGWFDVVGLTGLAEGHRRQIRPWTCDKYPLLLLIGIKPISLRNGILYVSRGKNISTTISLSHLANTETPIEMRLARSNKLVCGDLRAAEFDSDQPSCADVSVFFRRLASSCVLDTSDSCVGKERSLGSWTMRRMKYEDGYACVAELEDPARNGTWTFELDADSRGELTIRVPEMQNPEGDDGKNSEHPTALRFGRQAVPALLKPDTYRPELAVRFNRRLQSLLASAVDLRVSAKAREFRVRTDGSAEAVRFLKGAS